MSEYVEKKFAASTVEVNYVEGPDNGPPLVLIHGLGGRWSSWESVLDRLSDNWHIYAPELRGHGDTGWVPGGYEFNEYPTEIIEFLRQVVRQPAFVVGHSLGGVTSAVMCATDPGIIAAAVLEDPPLYIKEWFGESNFAPMFQSILDIRKKNLGVKETAVEIRKTDDVSSDDALVMRAMSIVKTDPEIWESALDARRAESWDPDAVLGAATPPVLLMQANPDRGGALRDVEATRAIDLLQQGRHVKWDDTGHSMHSEQPERFVQLINAYFGQILRNS